MDKREQAAEIFSGQFNCAQAVFVPFAEELGMDRLVALKLTSTLGGGMRSGQVCGAVAGALLALGLAHGHCDENDTLSKQKAYALATQFNQAFIEKNKTVVCKELLGYNVTDPKERDRAQGVIGARCNGFIEDAVKIVETLIVN